MINCGLQLKNYKLTEWISLYSYCCRGCHFIFIIHWM